jgi:uncharacterized protein YdaU (DUF1376 family)
VTKKKEKSPAFQYYPKDMETDEVVKLMSNRQFGAYVRLLGHNWIEGSIPANPDHLATLVHEDSRDFEPMWALISKKFHKKGDRLTNPRLEKERKRQRKYSLKQRQNVAKRWADGNDKDSDSITPPSVPPYESGIELEYAKSYSSSSSSSSITTIYNTFENLWDKYPRRLGKKAAFKHFRAAIKAKIDPQRIEQALANYVGYIQDKRIKEEFIKHGSTWFNNWEEWESYVPRAMEANIKASQIAKQEAERKAKQSKEEAAKEEAFNKDLAIIHALPYDEYAEIQKEAGQRMPKNRIGSHSQLLLPALLVEVWRERRPVPV